MCNESNSLSRFIYSIILALSVLLFTVSLSTAQQMHNKSQIVRIDTGGIFTDKIVGPVWIERITIQKLDTNRIISESSYFTFKSLSNQIDIWLKDLPVSNNLSFYLPKGFILENHVFTEKLPHVDVVLYWSGYKVKIE
jgi:hypothetical protein